MCEILNAYSEKLVIARKPHRCCETGRTIEIGEKYWSCRGLLEDSWCTYRQCVGAYHFSRAINAASGECAYGFGEIHQAVEDWSEPAVACAWEQVMNGADLGLGVMKCDKVKGGA